jgi:V/A-type H+-transporting ATPase subunit D
VELEHENIMSVDVPVFKRSEENDDTGEFPYGFGFTSAELDQAVFNYRKVLNTMLELAQREKSAQLLAAEIEKTRRRVNALEYVMIPQLIDKIREITMKLEENERGNITRLMKVKDMMIKQTHQMK